MLTPNNIILIIFGYFILLIAISFITSKGSDKDSFFTGNKKSPWFVVAYGMIGAALSGVTFVSLPDKVIGNNMHFGQFLLGNVLGYLFITFVLIPLYYRMNLVSIYGYLNKRFGTFSYKTGSVFFLISQSFGAALRMLLAIKVIQLLLQPTYDIPIWALALVFIVLIYLYTFRSGIKTIVWTDMLQTTFLLATVFFVVFKIWGDLDLNWNSFWANETVIKHSKFFDWDIKSGSYFWKNLISGMLIAIAMMGLDQNMMQKSLTIKKVSDAQKNTLSFSLFVGLAQMFFLFLGLLLFLYATQNQIVLPEGSDKLFPYLTLQKFGIVASVLFVLGISAAAFSSADSSLTALTTSFCFDFLKLDKTKNINTTKNTVHIGFSVVLFFIIVGFSTAEGNIIDIIFKVAAYTYAPLLGLFMLGIFTKVKVLDIATPIACVLSVLINWQLIKYLKEAQAFDLGFLAILTGAVLTVILLLIFKLIPYNKPTN